MSHAKSLAQIKRNELGRRSSTPPSTYSAKTSPRPSQQRPNEHACPAPPPTATSPPKNPYCRRSPTCTQRSPPSTRRWTTSPPMTSSSVFSSFSTPSTRSSSPTRFTSAPPSRSFTRTGCKHGATTLRERPTSAHAAACDGSTKSSNPSNTSQSNNANDCEQPSRSPSASI